MLFFAHDVSLTPLGGVELEQVLFAYCSCCVDGGLFLLTGFVPRVQLRLHAGRGSCLEVTKSGQECDGSSGACKN